MGWQYLDDRPHWHEPNVCDLPNHVDVEVKVINAKHVALADAFAPGIVDTGSLQTLAFDDVAISNQVVVVGAYPLKAESIANVAVLSVSVPLVQGSGQTGWPFGSVKGLQAYLQSDGSRNNRCSEHFLNIRHIRIEPAHLSKLD